jgi:ornithine carbamoyltransferase
MNMIPPVRHLISISDLTDDDLVAIVTQGARFAGCPDARPPALLGLVTGMYFRKTSTRTRCAFSVGALRLGGQIVALGPDDLQTGTGETIEDTGRVLSRMFDLLVARTAAGTEELRTWSAQARMAVINAMSLEEHPTQALADLTTLQCHFGQIDDLRILYIGEGNSTAAALVLALTRFSGVELHLRTPPGYGLDPAVRARGVAQAKRAGGALAERHDMAAIPHDVDVVYTSRWRTTGTVKPYPNWRGTFAPFQVGAELWRKSPTAVFMHDLPAHRGEEVTAEVLDGEASIAFAQAGNKLHSAMSVLSWCSGR